MRYYKSRVPTDMTAADLNEVLKRCGKEQIITKVLYLDQTERGDEYTVVCSDGEEKVMLQHFFTRTGITWMWEEGYDEFRFSGSFGDKSN